MTPHSEVALSNPVKAERLFALPQREAMRHIDQMDVGSIPSGRGLALRRREKELQRRAGIADSPISTAQIHALHAQSIR